MTPTRVHAINEAIDEAATRRGWERDHIVSQAEACLIRGARDNDVRDALYCLGGDPDAAHLGLTDLPAVVYGLSIGRGRRRPASPPEEER